MNKTIWKFPLEVVDDQAILMPEGAEVLTVQVQDGEPCIWALVDPNTLVRGSVVFLIRGTGHDVDDVGKYVGTFQLLGGEFVGHVFLAPEDVPSVSPGGPYVDEHGVTHSES